MAREKTGFHQAELAAAVGVAEETVFSYEAGRRRPRREVVLRMARAMHLDGATTNLILTEAGLAPIPSELSRTVVGLPSADPRFRPERWQVRATRMLALVGDMIQAHPWPCWVLDGQCRFVGWNDAAARVLGWEQTRTAGSSSPGTFIELVLSRPFREQVVNYDEVLSAVIPSGLKQLVGSEGGSHTARSFQLLLERLQQDDPDAVRHLQAISEASTPTLLSTRAVSPVVWRQANGRLLTFHGVISLWSDIAWYWAFDWHPADAATWEWLSREP